MLRRILIGLAIVAGLIVLVGAGLLHWFLRGDGVRRALETQASARLGQPVQIGDADVRLLPRPALELSGVTIGEPAVVTLARVQVSAGLGGLLSRRVEDAELVIADSEVALPLALGGLAAAAGEPADGAAARPGAGAPAAPPTAAAPRPEDGGPAFTIASVRTIRLDNVRLTGRGREIVVSARGALEGSTFELTSLEARSGATSLEARGTVALEPRIDANLAVTADRIAVDELLALAGAFTPPEESGTPASGGGTPDARVVADVRANVVQAAGVDLTAFAATLTSEDGRVTIQPASFNLFGGSFSGRVRADLGEPSALDLSADAELRGLDVAALAAFGGADGAITGRLSTNARFTGRGADASAALAAMRGDGTVTIADGTLTGLDLVRTVVLFFGRPAADAPASAGSRFDRIEAQFTLANRVLRADPLTLRSQDADVEGQVRLALATEALDGRARLILSEALSAQAGTDLARFTREGNRIVLPATIGGTLGKPSVRIDASETIQRGLKNELQRRLDRFLGGKP
jgi:hypothetical protein